MSTTHVAHSWALPKSGDFNSGPWIGGPVQSRARSTGDGNPFGHFNLVAGAGYGNIGNKRCGSAGQQFLGTSWTQNRLWENCFSRLHAIALKSHHKIASRKLCCLKVENVKTETKARKVVEQQPKELQSADLDHIGWWDAKLKSCVKPLTKAIIARLKYDNLLGLDESLRGGSLKKGTKSAELLEMKRRFPHQVFLCRAGEIYEAVGIDACMLVEYLGVTPMGGKDSIPKAGCPMVNLRQALDELTGQGFSVCVVEEVQGGTQVKGRRKERFIAGHAHPGSPYVYGLAAENIDLDFPDPIPVVGISHSNRGYCLVYVSETLHTFFVEDELTEEAVVAKMRAHHGRGVFMHCSLHSDASGNGSWGKRGVLWNECQSKTQEWYEGDPVDMLLLKVRELYALDPHVQFREIVVPPGERPRPLYVGTASQIGILPTVGVPSLLEVCLPQEANHLCTSYMRDLLLHPPPYRVAESIQAACRQLAEVTSTVPDFTCVSAAKVKKLIEAKEANHIELTRMFNMAQVVVNMAADPELCTVLEFLLDPTWLATGLRVGRRQLVDDCKTLASRIGRILACEGDTDQGISTAECIPEDFFRDLEDHWRGHVKWEHANEVYGDVRDAAVELSAAVKSDLHPVVLSMEADISKGLKPEICYSSEDQAVWLRSKNIKLSGGSDVPGETELKCLIPALDSKGKKVGDEWWTTSRIESALVNYRTAVDKASAKVVEVLRDLAEDLKPKVEVLVFISVLSVIAKTLYMHVGEAKRRSWAVPTLPASSKPTGKHMQLVDLIPYWNDPTVEKAEPNTVDMESMFLLTGPNGGGKSSMLRSVCAAALLAMCGLMVPAREASVPQLDAIMLRMMSTDSPADSKSSFQMEMSEVRTILAEATDRSLVLVDEICRGTDVEKGSFIAASVVEALDHIGCIGILSTHLHNLLDMELQTSNVVLKAMGTKEVNGRVEPTWKLGDGACRESLAFDVARKEGVPEPVVQRAEELCMARRRAIWSMAGGLDDATVGGKKASENSSEDRMTAERLFLLIARFIINWKQDFSKL